MVAVQTHLYYLIYNEITTAVNRSLPAILEGTTYSPLKSAYSARHTPSRSIRSRNDMRSYVRRDLAQLSQRHSKSSSKSGCTTANTIVVGFVKMGR
ncbi:hypothetical protein V1525DRAFT_393084 [Lipomyces kononenkoae]|uniref:Uncharacterized protein n=1 Tax=Lipomyces kononenkoae TaxID=34357 RepID=A0ACC3TBU2_LIPKO